MARPRERDALDEADVEAVVDVAVKPFKPEVLAMGVDSVIQGFIKSLMPLFLVVNVEHLFSRCHVAVSIWELPREVFEWLDDGTLTAKKKEVVEVVICTVLWVIWRYRNDVVHVAGKLKRDIIFDVVREYAFLSFCNRQHRGLDQGRSAPNPLYCQIVFKFKRLVAVLAVDNTCDGVDAGVSEMLDVVDDGTVVGCPWKASEATKYNHNKTETSIAMQFKNYNAIIRSKFFQEIDFGTKH
ncbi:hypothetical protein LXL04_002633 [Taraxacum kok-saghyz]